jgi:hypothetical protein
LEELVNLLELIGKSCGVKILRRRKKLKREMEKNGEKLNEESLL